MKLIIDIPKEYYELYKSAWEHLDHLHFEHNFNFTQELAIANGTPLPENPTNGDVIKALFSTAQVEKRNIAIYAEFTADSNVTTFDPKWWNSPYKEVEHE